MSYMFSSILKDVIRDFLNEKRSLGYNYETEERHLRRIDQLANSLSLNEVKITRELANEYLKKKSYEKLINISHRAQVLRELSRYMVRFGYEAYIIPQLPPSYYRSDFVPYIFSDEELSRLFAAIDKWAVSKSLDGQYYPQRKKYPVIFRILYSTGMRISEVLKLKLKDIDFVNHTFTIREAKNHSERIIPVHTSIIQIISLFTDEEKIYDINEYIFKGQNKDNHVDRKTVEEFFRKFLSLANIPHPKDGPRIHSLRHTFCVHRLKLWVLEGRDITALFPYLCAYMGHKDTRCTEYYLRLTADLYPDIVYKSERYLNGDDNEE